MNSCSSPTHFLTLEMSGLPAGPAPSPPPSLPPSFPVTCWDTCVYVCERAWGIIEQTLVPLIGTFLCLWLVGRLDPWKYHRAYKAWCLELPRALACCNTTPFSLETAITEKLWTLTALSAPCAPWAYIQEKLAWLSFGLLPSDQRA